MPPPLRTNSGMRSIWPFPRARIVRHALGAGSVPLAMRKTAARQPRYFPSTSLNASRAFRKASIPDGMPQYTPT
jgi:hypothetical protein